MSNEISKQILDEMIELGAAVINLIAQKPVPRSVSDQIIKSVTSIGANYSEAQNASSRRDFINKIYIAKKEAAETSYWLQLIMKLQGSSSQLLEMEDKTQRFVMLLQKIINSTRTKSPQGNG